MNGLPSVSRSHWRIRIDETFDLLNELGQCRDVDRLRSRFMSYVQSLGATHVLAGVIPHAGASQREQLSHILLDAWPQEWSERYFSCGYLYRDPTIRLVRQGSRPFMWNEIDLLNPRSLRERTVMLEATEFRLHQGFTIALATVERRPLGFSIAGERLEVDDNERLALEFVATFAAGCAIVLKGGEKRPDVHLSPRQIDVLRWASEGLKNDDIAERLSISVHTADMHLRAARERLGVTNTVHAVAEAFRLRLLF
ncbi:autoinducer binding domain-containing protein [Aminobacter aganoensis]|uniref:LuxR family quorum sensing-dependent transcriptional regulator n=1 Tax=Aminobacter aganoensis TaxID=83264 RepID=A0A7X0KNJ5_9HYPH|nr:LuxR family transcriptional regulator [Aminobacter aganoensis]MBB6357238.1 LuxR family quorum sensing-dependent transcriptional regulator [Aminobacter aganoensis]